MRERSSAGSESMSALVPGGGASTAGLRSHAVSRPHRIVTLIRLDGVVTAAATSLQVYARHNGILARDGAEAEGQACDRLRFRCILPHYPPPHAAAGRR